MCWYGLLFDDDVWMFEWCLFEYFVMIWCELDEGIWEVCSGWYLFMLLKVMVWVVVESVYCFVCVFGYYVLFDVWWCWVDVVCVEVFEYGYYV